MTLKRIIDRKLIMLVVSPLLRRVGTALAVYAASKGVPSDLLDQFLQAAAVILGLALDIGLATANKKRSDQATIQRVLNDQEITRLSLEAGINPLSARGPLPTVYPDFYRTKL